MVENLEERLKQIFAGPEEQIPNYCDMPAIAVSRVVRALVGIESNCPAIKSAADWLLSIQNDDGGWGLVRGDCSRPFSTFWVTRTLANTVPDFRGIGQKVRRYRRLISGKHPKLVPAQST